MRIILDKDEVLADFVSGACHAWGVSPADVQGVWEPGIWHVKHPIAKLLQREISEEEFWEPINDQGAGFWEDLEPLPWFDELIALVKRHTDDWHIATSPSKHITCYDGKVRWIKKKFGNDFNRFSINPHKEIYANPYTVLIDDRDENVRLFRNTDKVRPAPLSGWGIVFPSIANSLNRLRHEPIRYVKAALAATSCHVEMQGQPRSCIL